MVSRRDLSAQVEAEVAGWEGVSTEPHRFGGVEFNVGRREIGHIHRNGGVLDIPFPKRIRDALVAAGWTGPHHVLPETGWTTFHVDSEDAVTEAVRLMRMSYLLTVIRRPERAPGVNVAREVERLALTGDVAALFERLTRRSREGGADNRST
jgi:hypothetical protein